MFSLTIVFGPGPMVWTLMFKTAEVAISNKNKLDADAEGNIDLVDDFGQSCSIRSEEIHGWMLEDLEQSKLAHIERALHQTRVKVKADEMARADPVIRAAAMQGNSPILQPAMPANGGWRG